MQLSRSVIDSTYSCATDFELTNERDTIKIAPNSCLSNNNKITHVRPSESCLKYSISWKNTELKFAPNCDRFGQLKIIPNQRIGIIGRVELTSRGDWQIGGIPEHQRFKKWFNLDILDGLLIILRETDHDCRIRLHGSNAESLPNYTILESINMPPNYGGDEESEIDMGAIYTKVFNLPFSAQQSLIRKLAPFSENAGYKQEVFFMILVVAVVFLAVLPIILGGRISFFFYWPIMGIMIVVWMRIIFRNYLSLIRVEKFRVFLKTIKMYDVTGLYRNLHRLEGEIVYVEGFCRASKMTLEAPFQDEECLYWWLIAAKK